MSHGLENMAHMPAMVVEAKEEKTFLLYEFPAAKAKIAKLTLEQKNEWYHHQFSKNPAAYPVELTSKEFERFWRWRFYVPTRMVRLFFKVKNFEFKRHHDITQIRKQRERRGPETI